MKPTHPVETLAEAASLGPTVSANVAVLLRAEALVELCLAVWAYSALGGAWPVFLALFLAPDLSMIGYLVNPRIGARLYNAGHTTLAPAFLALAGFALAIPLLYSLALIWLAHIGFDRFIGYGLKFPQAFAATHLGWKSAPSGFTTPHSQEHP